MTSSVGELTFNRALKLPMILQDERAECGHACVAMVSNYWGHRLDLYSIRGMSNTSSRGVTLLDINQLFEKLGFTTRALQVPMEELYLIKCPAILHWNRNHFVVLKKVKRNRFVIHDPAMGVRNYSLEQFSKCFTGIVLEVEKTNDFKEIYSQEKLTLYQLFKTVRGVNKFIILLLLLSISIEILCLLNPLLIQYVADDVIGFSEQGNLYVIASGFFVLTILQVFTEYLRGNLIIFFTSHLTEQFSSNLVRHILNYP
jgi:ATP-binding cassette subfamily B protein RaxB